MWELEDKRDMEEEKEKPKRSKKRKQEERKKKEDGAQIWAPLNWRGISYNPVVR